MSNILEVTPSHVPQSISRELRQEIPVAHYTRRMDRLIPDLAASLDKVRTATFEDWQTIGFVGLQREGLATIISNEPSYAIVAQTKNNVNAYLDTLVVCLPHIGYPIAHTIDDLPPSTQGRLGEALDRSVSAIERVANTGGLELTRTYVLQHIAADEQNDLPFHNSFPQTHFHVFGVTRDDLEKSEKNARGLFSGKEYRYQFYDPTIYIAYDLYKKNFGPATLDLQTGSIIISQRDMEQGDSIISPDDLKKIDALMNKWKAVRNELASCYTDFTKDEDGRLVPLHPQARVRNVEGFIKDNPDLSKNSQDVLMFLATNIKPFDSTNKLNALYNSIAGSVGWTVDYETRTVSLRFAPRSFASSEKTGATDGLYTVLKNRDHYIEGDERDKFIQYQRRLIEEISLPSDEELTPIEFKPNIFINRGSIYKTHRRFTADEIMERYEQLQQAGIDVGAAPNFLASPTRGLVEINELILGIDGGTFLATSGSIESLEFYSNVMLENVDKVRAVHEPYEALTYALDPVPQNFVFDPYTKSFVYIDYEPLDTLASHKHLLNAPQLIHYALVKFGREKPQLFNDALDLTIARYHDTSTRSYLEQLPYQKVAQFLLQEDYASIGNLIRTVTDNDEILGLAVMLITGLSYGKMQDVADILSTKYAFSSAVTDKSELRVQVGLFLTRTLAKNRATLKDALVSLMTN